jgi:prevent-host-death family protein
MKTAKTYTVSEAREHFAEVLETVEQGEEVTITKYGEPVATISPASRSDKQKRMPLPGFLAVQGWTLTMGDDFDAIPEGFEDYV